MEMKVYKAINAVQAELAKTGIAKDRQAQGYKFRGIDDVFNAIAPLLAANQLCILPRMLSRHAAERVNKNGTQITFVTVDAEFDFVSAEDGSKHTVRTFGEAMDVSDKATNKAMSAAYKYAAFQSFAIPTEGDNDIENYAHELQPLQEPSRVVIDGLKDAASRGSADLEKAFKANQKTPYFAEWWQANGKALKDLAAQADAA